MREQTSTQRTGRSATTAKGRGSVAGAAQQRPAPRKSRAASSGQSRGGSRSSIRTIARLAPFVGKTLLAVCAGLLVYAGYRAAASASFFDLKSVEVEGASRSSRDDVKAAVERAVSPVGVWRADLEGLSEELEEMPWVRAAYVQRVLPSGVRVKVVEREPRMIARTAAGRLVWVDEDGVTLGAASSAAEQDFIIHGLEESRNEQARERNRERMKAALEMKREWELDGSSERVSDVNLSDLRDVRVRLSGEDSRIEVRLGREEHVARMREALEKLDEQRATPLGEHVIYIDMATGKNAIFGYPQDARSARRDESEEPRATEEAAPADARREDAIQSKKEKKKSDARKRQLASPRAQREAAPVEKDARDASNDKPAAALRERRVGELD